MGRFDNSLAFLVGVSGFAVPHPKLPEIKSAHLDVRLLHRILSRTGYPEENIIELTNGDATQVGIYSGFDKLADKCRLKKAESLLFFFAGHGWHTPARSYLLPYDATTEPLSKAFDVGEVAEIICRRLMAQKKAIFFDACRVGGFRREFMYGKFESDDTAFIAASGPGENEVSYENDQNGFFARRLAEAIWGLGGSDAAGFVQIETIYLYLNETIPLDTRNVAKEQHPYRFFAGRDIVVSRSQCSEQLRV